MEAVIRQGGQVPIDELLRIRIRYFSDGLALGSQAFVERVFRNNRESFGNHRRRAGTSLQASSWAGLHVMRDLRKQVYG